MSVTIISGAVQAHSFKCLAWVDSFLPMNFVLLGFKTRNVWVVYDLCEFAEFCVYV